jgi:hypothetical protein
VLAVLHGAPATPRAPRLPLDRTQSALVRQLLSSEDAPIGA